MEEPFACVPRAGPGLPARPNYLPADVRYFKLALSSSYATYASQSPNLNDPTWKLVRDRFMSHRGALIFLWDSVSSIGRSIWPTLRQAGIWTMSTRTLLWATIRKLPLLSATAGVAAHHTAVPVTPALSHHPSNVTVKSLVALTISSGRMKHNTGVLTTSSRTIS